jgi:hypothetical protein
MVGAASFHQNIKPFILDNAEGPHTFSYPFNNFYAVGFMESLSRDQGHEAEFLLSFFLRVISM